jgi:hypothetical protein
MNAQVPPARRLPRSVRPVGGETTTSYVVRLAAANHIRYTDLLRELGRCWPFPPSKQVFDCETRLNPLALDRLAVLSDYPVERLQKALPALTGWHAYQLNLPADIPAIRFTKYHGEFSDPCPDCLTRRGIHVPVKVYRPRGQLMCLRHRRWLNIAFTDVAELPEVATAQRSLHRLLRQHQHSYRVQVAVSDSAQIANRWLREQARAQLSQRWLLRLQALGHSYGPDDDLTTLLSTPVKIAVLPEAVALGRTLVDILDDRGLLTLPPIATYAIHIKVNTALGLPRYHQPRGLDPLTRWIKVQHHQVRQNYGRAYKFHHLG